MHNELVVLGNAWARAESEDGQRTYVLNGVTIRDGGKESDPSYRFTAEENSSKMWYSDSTPEDALTGLLGELRDCLSIVENVAPPGASRKP